MPLTVCINLSVVLYFVNHTSFPPIPCAGIGYICINIGTQRMWLLRRMICLGKIKWGQDCIGDWQWWESLVSRSLVQIQLGLLETKSYRHLIDVSGLYKINWWAQSGRQISTYPKSTVLIKYALILKLCICRSVRVCLALLSQPFACNLLGPWFLMHCTWVDPSTIHYRSLDCKLMMAGSVYVHV